MTTVFFNNKNEFKQFLEEHHEDSKGVWIKFDKRPTPNKLTPEEALEEALCFGWIDSTIKSIDSTYYIKYFTHRNKNSKWSSKNKILAEQLIKNNRMTPYGQNEIDLAKADGRWETSDSLPNDFNIDAFHDLLRDYNKAYSNYLNMSFSVQRTYAISYFALKKQESRDRRLKVVIERLEKNLPPM
jgi:uncharacterized protein YdeI (YjbR/CyaY-like superfamily)